MLTGQIIQPSESDNWTEMVPETPVIFNKQARLRAGEEFINFSSRESFES